MNENAVKLAGLAAVLCATALGLFIASQQLAPLPAAQQAAESAASPPAQPALPQSSAAPQKPEPAPPVSIRFVAVGDNLVHANLYKQAAARAVGKDFDFAPVYEQVAPIFSGADVAFVNQESMIAQRAAPLAGYPLFNSPEAVGDELVSLGFNVINLANNHMFDLGEPGLQAPLDYWQEKPGVLAVGAWRTEGDMQKPMIFEAKGIKIGFVAMTESTNGMSLPAGTPMRYIRTDEYDLIKQQIALARSQADFVVASVHWGTENSTETNDQQIALAQMLADWGADLVIGHHPHTLQPMEWRTGAKGNRMLVAYSLGNLISSMLNPQNMLGGVLDLTIEMDPETRKTGISSAHVIPIVTHYDGAGRQFVHTLPFSQYTEAMAEKHGVKVNYGFFGAAYIHGIIDRNIPAAFLDSGGK
jgi:poly-gamma-glutamate synthesis protein (capsule biosynthesis protein)